MIIGTHYGKIIDGNCCGILLDELGKAVAIKLTKEGVTGYIDSSKIIFDRTAQRDMRFTRHGEKVAVVIGFLVTPVFLDNSEGPKHTLIVDVRHPGKNDENIVTAIANAVTGLRLKYGDTLNIVLNFAQVVHPDCFLPDAG